VAIDIEFARDLAVHKHRYDDLRLGFERAGEITRVFLYVVDYNRFADDAAAPQIP